MCLSMGYLHHRIPFFQSCSSVNSSHRKESFRNWLVRKGSPTSHNFCQKLCFCKDPSPQAAAPARNVVQHEFSTQPPSGTLLLWNGIPYRLVVDMNSILDRHGQQGNNLHHHGLFQGLPGISSLAPGASPPPRHSLTLQPAGLFHIFSLLFFTICLQDFFYSFLELLLQRHYHYHGQWA